MPRAMISLAVLAALAYVGICSILFVFQRSLVYLPQPFPRDTLARALPLKVDGAEILVTVRPKDGPRALIYFGGNAEVVPWSVPELAEAFPDRALYLPHYRGYGGSTGSPSEDALLADALEVYDMVRRSHDDIVVMGRSLGSSIATHLAARRPVSRLILVTPFDSLQEVAARHYPIFPVRLLLLDRYDARSWAPQVEAPTILLAAERDEIVPRRSAERLHASFRPGLATMRVIPGTGHNTISMNPEYFEALKAIP